MVDFKRYFVVGVVSAVCTIYTSWLYDAYKSYTEKPQFTAVAGAQVPIEEKVVEVVVEPVVEPEPILRTYYEVPLDTDLQDYIIELCDGYSIDPTIVFAMIEKESRYNPQAVGDGGKAFGLMQIHPRWHQHRMDRLFGSEGEWLNPYHNVAVGIDILRELDSEDRGLVWTLMAYNGGNAYANRKILNGEVSDYAAEVMSRSDKIGVYTVEIQSI